ncbi:MAG: hypothetical protein RLZZ157_552, partial [Pseudomonadota bacterium]
MRRLREVGAEAALVEFGDGGAFQFVAFVEEGHAECEANIFKYLCVLRPCDDGA